MISLSERLKQLRQSHNITQKQLAESIGASERGIQNYEMSVRKPTTDVLIALADYFDVPLDYLLGRGVFKNWEEVMELKLEIFSSINQNFENLPYDLSQLSENLLTKILPSLISKIEIVDHEINIYWLI